MALGAVDSCFLASAYPNSVGAKNAACDSKSRHRYANISPDLEKYAAQLQITEDDVPVDVMLFNLTRRSAVINQIQDLEFNMPVILLLGSMAIDARVAFVGRNEKISVLVFTASAEQEVALEELQAPTFRAALARELQSHVGSPANQTNGEVADGQLRTLKEFPPLQADQTEPVRLDDFEKELTDHTSQVDPNLRDESAHLLRHITSATRASIPSVDGVAEEAQVLGEPSLLPDDKLLLFESAAQFLNHYENHLSHGVIYAECEPLRIGNHQDITLSLPAHELSIALSARVGYVEDGKVGLMIQQSKQVLEELASFVAQLRPEQDA